MTTQATLRSAALAAAAKFSTDAEGIVKAVAGAKDILDTSFLAFCLQMKKDYGNDGLDGFPVPDSEPVQVLADGTKQVNNNPAKVPAMVDGPNGKRKGYVDFYRVLALGTHIGKSYQDVADGYSDALADKADCKPEYKTMMKAELRSLKKKAQNKVQDQINLLKKGKQLHDQIKAVREVTNVGVRFVADHVNADGEPCKWNAAGATIARFKPTKQPIIVYDTDEITNAKELTIGMFLSLRPDQVKQDNWEGLIETGGREPGQNESKNKLPAIADANAFEAFAAHMVNYLDVKTNYNMVNVRFESKTVDDHFLVTVDTLHRILDNIVAKHEKKIEEAKLRVGKGEANQKAA